MENNPTDAELWKSFKTGEEFAFSQIYKRYIKELYRYGQKISGNSKIVEDAIQDMFVDIWNSRERLTEPDSVKYYLFRILRRKINRNLIYPNSLTPLNDQDSDHFIITEPYETEWVRMEADELKSRKLQNAILLLPTRQQEAVNLRYYHSFTHHQIADMMDISVQSVHNTLQKAMKGLRDLLHTYPRGMLVVLYLALSDKDLILAQLI